MSGSDTRIIGLLQEARRQLEAERHRRSGPIAIVGMGCRFPGGVATPSDFWRMLQEGVDASSEVPRSRWDAEGLFDPDPEAPGRSYVKRGSFLSDIEGFDPDFFGISPREALGMDPQQRLLLEVAWEALEDAGIPPASLRGSATGVWIGLCLDDYARRSLTSGDVRRIDAYSTLGNTRSIAAGRLSYVMDLRGPAVQLDTACSSSLVAVHQACASLRAGESDLALVGGVNLMSSPEGMIALCKLRALAKDGRCKTFDASADGYGRGEGCGIVVLKRLADAQRDGDRIHALIRGTAVNHDGHSNGLTAPSGLAQEAVIRAALQNGDIAPGSVGFVETHGTGTLLGDPIEVLALDRVYGKERPAHSPLYLGAVKTNFGHLEGAAGVAGLIKAALCVQKGAIPPHLHLTQPNPKIPWRDLRVQVQKEGLDWQPSEQPRTAGVSSFGISGTNAHVVLEQPPPATPAAAAPGRSAELILLSAKSAGALAGAAARLAELLDNQRELSLSELASNLVYGRSLFERRLTFTATSTSELISALKEAGSTAAALGSSAPARGKLAWLFTGQGAQQLGMGKDLYREWPAFRAAFDEVCSHIDPLLPLPLREVIWAEPGSAHAGKLDQTQYTQPALFAFEWALASLWSSWGVQPDVVLGHSIGELTAACWAGLFTLADAARLVCSRGALMQALPPGGAMVAVAAPESQVAPLLQRYAGKVSLAAVNSPGSVVISGSESAVLELAGELSRQRVRTTRLVVSHAFHSSLMDPMLEEFRRVASALEFQPPTVRILSNLSARLDGSSLASPDYWVRHIREPVRFADGIQAAAELGVNTFLEVGPRSTLLGLVPASLPGSEPLLLPSLRPGRAETAALLDALGTWVCRGGEIDWAQVVPPRQRRYELPTYAWQHTRYWLEPAEAAPGAATRSGAAGALHGARIASAGHDAAFETVWTATQPQWLENYRVGGRVLVPLAGLVELVRGAAEEQAGGAPRALRALALEAPLLLEEEQGRRVQVIFTAEGNAAVYSQPAAAPPEEPWTRHAAAELSAPAPAPMRLDVAALRQRCNTAVPASETQARLSSLALELGALGPKALWRNGAEALAEVAVELDGAPEAAPGEAYGLHPALLDAAFHAAACLLPAADHAMLPFEVQGLTVHQLGAASALVHARLLEAPSVERARIAVTLVDETGAAIAEIAALHLRRAQPTAKREPRTRLTDDAFYQLSWQPTEAPAPVASVASGSWQVLAIGDEGAARALAKELGAQQLPLASARQQAPADNVVCLFSSDGSAEAALEAANAGLELARWLAQSSQPTRLWWITSNAWQVTTEDAADPAAASVWGMGRVLLQEQPALRLTLLDVSAGTSAAEALRREAASSSDENQVAWSAGQRHVARLVPAPRAAPRALALRTGSAVITGGLGALGGLVARALVRRGLGHILLLSRRGLEAPAAAETLAELRALGARVSVAAVDITDRAALAQALATLPADLPLRAVIHAAGVLDDGMLVDQTPERIRKVMSPKVLGAWNLHELTAHADLDLFVMFSSLAGTAGSLGQAGYAAANAFLDALAQARRSRGLPATSLAWGPWSSGMAGELSDELKARFSRRGITLISPEHGLHLFDEGIARPEPALVVAPLQLRVLQEALGDDIPPLWRALIRKPAAAAGRSRGASSWQLELQGMSPSERAHAVSEAVRAEVARVLSASSPGQLPVDRPLRELGFDSLMAVELRNRLARRAGAALPATLVFDYPTIDGIAGYLLADVLQLAPAAVPPPMAERQHAADEPIAVIGMGMRFPGDVNGAADFWQLLDNGRDAITEVPPERWDVDLWYDPSADAAGKMNTRWGGFLRDLERFDPTFFGITPREAASIDPQERLLLETSWEALEHAGLQAEALMGSRAGVFMGLCGSEYQARVMADAEAIDVYSMLGTMHSTIVGRLSYWLGLKGPCLSVDTACSSSLVSVHLACQALRNGECHLALAGGANVVLEPEGAVYFSRLGVLSPRGRCRSFAADADGYVRSEGAGVIVLERLSDALQNGRTILAVIRGSSVNQDGRSNGLAAPNGPAQQAVIREALDRAGVAPADVSYVECFAVGTSLGDSIEVQALDSVLAQHRPKASPLIVGSVKSNLGHMEGAAGIGALIKTVLSLQHERIPKSLHASELNPNVAWDALGLKVATETCAWPRGASPRVAGVSSFGIAGTNAHVIVQEAPAATPAQAAPERAAELILLSAKSPAALAAASMRLRLHLAMHPELSLHDVAFSLTRARSQLEHRLALAVTSREELIEALGLAAAGKAPEGAVRGSVRPTRAKLAWLFGDVDELRPGLGRQLCAEWPAFRAAFDAALSAVNAHLDVPLEQVLWSRPGSAPAAALAQHRYRQPAAFVFQWALGQLWRAWGMEPDIVTGRGVGEIAAAAWLGRIDLGSAARLACARGQLWQAAGSADAPAQLQAFLAAAPLVHASESHVSLLLESCLAGAAELGTAAHWSRHALPAAGGAELVRALDDAAADVVLELGYEQAFVSRSFAGARQASARALHQPFAARPESAAVLQALAAWALQGGKIDWSAVFPGGGQRVLLPSYPWQRERYWIERSRSRRASADSSEQIDALLRRVAARGKLSAAAQSAIPDILDALRAEWTPAERETGGAVSTELALPLATPEPQLREQDSDTLQRLLQAPAAQRPAALLELVSRELSRALAIPGGSAISPTARLLDLGLDSLRAIDLRAALSRQLRAPLPPTVLLDHPTVTELADYLAQQLDSLTTVGGASPEPLAARPVVSAAGHTAEAGFDNVLVHAVGVPSPAAVRERSGSVDAAAVVYLPPAPERVRQHLTQLVFPRALAAPIAVHHTEFGKIALIAIALPREEIYAKPEQLLSQLGEALQVAGSLGARCVSLTGLIPSGTSFGHALQNVRQPEAPLITTGHATTVAAVVFALKRALEKARLQLADEALGIVGLGSIGSASLQLALSVLPRPRRVLLCDLFSKEAALRELAATLEARFGVQTEICLAPSGRVPDGIYEARVLIGATNVPGVLDIQRLQPGSVIVDDSAPHCFDTAALRRRLATQGDLFANEAGLLQGPARLRHEIFLPVAREDAVRLLSPTFLHQAFGERHIMGCIMSSLLSGKLDLPRTLGFVQPDDAVRHYRLLEQLGYGAPDEVRIYDFTVGSDASR